MEASEDLEIRRIGEKFYFAALSYCQMLNENAPKQEIERKKEKMEKYKELLEKRFRGDFS